MLSIPVLLEKKLDKNSLTNDEIEFFIKGVYEGSVHMAQLGAFLASVKILGMSMEETSHLTRCMIKYSSQLTWPAEWKNILVDKHSTGGVGDKISLVLAPLLAACGAKVPMISGRGLGITGGTIDKLESIKGFQAEVSQTEAHDILNTVGCFIAGQSKDLVPTDKVMYSIRDITGTVRSKPLIAASIISKKASENISNLILDVKFGPASLNKSLEIAEDLAKLLVSVGESNNMRTAAMISGMNAPLGKGLGNALEIAETLQCLNGNFPEDIKELVFAQASHLLQSIKLASNNEEALKLCQQKIHSGEALIKFQQMLIGQKANKDLVTRLCEAGDRSIDDYMAILGYSSNKITEFKAEKSGFIKSLSAFDIGSTIWNLGGGRKVPSDNVDFGVGVVLKKSEGERVTAGETWAVVYHGSCELTDFIKSFMVKAICIEDECVERKSLIVKLITIQDC